MINKDLGLVTAYAYAVSKGYTGTEDEFAELMASYASVAEQAEESAEDSEAWAIGKRGGQDVPSTDVTYHNNSKYYADQAGTSASTAASSASAASASESNAAASASAAAGSASSATTSAATATEKAGEAATSATSASTSATSAAGSATNAASSATAASASATAAGNAQTAAETALGKAEDAQEAAEQAQSDAEAAAQSVSQSAAQISQNTSDISDLKSAVNDPVTGLDSKAPVIIDTASGSIASFPDGADGMPLHKLTVQIEPVQAGSGDPSPDNVRPISGWTGANVTRTGKNLYDISTYPMTADRGVVAANGSLTTDSRVKVSAFWPCHDFIGKSLTLNCRLGGIGTLGVCFYNESKVYINGFTDISVTPSTAPNTFTVPSGAYYLRFTALAAQTGIQIELGNEATTFEAYAGTTISISWQSEAGTVYGGTLTINDDGTGTLVSNVIYGTFNNETLLYYNQTFQLFYFFLESGIVDYPAATVINIHNPPPFTVISNLYSTANSYGVDVQNKTIALGTPGNFGDYVCVKNADYTNPDDFRAAMISQGMTVAYLLREDFWETYQLTQQQVIDTLYGTNNIWADCGDIEIEYRADTKLYIQKINAPADDDMTADAQIASGKYFIVGGNLYLSTTTIPAGDTIIPGTNCTKTNLAEALNALNT